MVFNSELIHLVSKGFIYLSEITTMLINFNFELFQNITFILKLNSKLAYAKDSNVIK